MSWLVAGLRALRGRWLQRLGRASRRRVDESVLGAVAFVVGLAALAGAYFGRTEQVTSMWALAEVGDEGPAQVTEVIDYDFGSKTGKHGIFRVVPGLNERVGDTGRLTRRSRRHAHHQGVRRHPDPDR